MPALIIYILNFGLLIAKITSKNSRYKCIQFEAKLALIVIVKPRQIERGAQFLILTLSLCRHKLYFIAIVMHTMQ